jgi:cytochrome d ubiquinol oxidase subunit I
MQHSVAFALNNDGTFGLTSLVALLTNPWAIWHYLHNMMGAVVTGSVAMAALGTFYLLMLQFEEFGQTFVRLGDSSFFPCRPKSGSSDSASQDR